MQLRQLSNIKICSPYPIRANYSERVGRKVTGLKPAKSGHGSGTAEETGTFTRAHPYRMGFFFGILGMDRGKTIEMLSAPRSGFSKPKAPRAELRDMTESMITKGGRLSNTLRPPKTRKGGSI